MLYTSGSSLNAVRLRRFLRRRLSATVETGTTSMCFLARDANNILNLAGPAYSTSIETGANDSGNAAGAFLKVDDDWYLQDALGEDDIDKNHESSSLSIIGLLLH